MNLNDYSLVQNLTEAYLNVYQEIDEATRMAELGYRETDIRNRIARNTKGGDAADRATALEKQPTYGNANKEKQRQNYARAQRGDFRDITSSNPGLRGYVHRSDDPEVKAKQAARGAQRSALTPNERTQLSRESYDIYDIILSHLLDEGYCNTVEAAEVLMVNMSEDWRDSIVEENIVRSGVSVNAAGKQIPWKHSHNTATGRSTVRDKFGERDASIRAKERKSTNK